MTADLTYSYKSPRPTRHSADRFARKQDRRLLKALPGALAATECQHIGPLPAMSLYSLSLVRVAVIRWCSFRIRTLPIDLYSHPTFIQPCGIISAQRNRTFV